MKGVTVMVQAEYEKWMNQKGLEEELLQELQGMDETAKRDAFYRSLEFGTGGMRGIIGAGTNRMNIYTIRKANVGFGTYLKNLYHDDVKRGVVIAHDNRNKSVEFAKESAKVLATFGITSYIFEALRPTPELSFAVRHLNAIGGIVVTASHNPPKYNGYKIYDEDGCQLVPKYADQVIALVDAVDDVFDIDVVDFNEAEQNGMITWIGEDIDKAYLDMVDTVQLRNDVPKIVDIVFTPLHGTSAMIGTKALQRNGYHVIPVEEQMVADPNFSTVKSPNPENKEAFEYAIRYGTKHNADILIATDPDADRLGVAVWHDGEYKLLTGNQTGAILVHYILHTREQQGTLPKQGMVYNTVVTSEFGATIAKAFGMGVKSTLTGFKFIGEQAKTIEATDTEFMFGYEESYGYVIKDFVRDKDSIQALLLISEVANVGKQTGKTLYDYLLFLYETYGYYVEDLVNIVLEGAVGEAKIKQIMATIRDNKPLQIGPYNVITVEDYLVGTRYIGDTTEDIDLPTSNVLKFLLDDGSWFVLRPSGTEPKLKIYIGVLGDSLAQSQTKNQQIKDIVLSIIERI
ncbi:phospho-sugar mutase [Candidatus Xianfuyuplasma coldseepsis]|uniref:Phospho-sugar mutase n=2 Tax=Candidatus Xianfuyuplasma coldseepsis TaxID=2782163 RepID=A0A7L7KP20_9MOLU|nr:phospho-sugar mutase [Xianfuyuplasma coldseepsis]